MEAGGQEVNTTLTMTLITIINIFIVAPYPAGNMQFCGHMMLCVICGMWWGNWWNDRSKRKSS